MYFKCIIAALKIAQTFPTNTALKQGGVFSTILFNIFKNDLPRELVEDSKFSETINETPCLDDVAIFSLYMSGLTRKYQYQNIATHKDQS